jgi:hypothetical protein
MRTLFALLLVATLGCGTEGDPTPPGPEFGLVRVVTSANGIDLDTNGYSVTALGASFTIGTRDTLFIPVAADTAGLATFGGISPSCWPTNGTVRLLPPIAAGDTFDVVFQAACGVIATTVIDSSFQFINFGLLNVTTGGFVPLPTRPWWTPQQVAWSADGTRLFIGYGDMTIWALELSGGSLTLFYGSADNHVRSFDQLPGSGFLIGGWVGSGGERIFTLAGPGDSLAPITPADSFSTHAARSPTRGEVVFLRPGPWGYWALNLMDGDGTDGRAVLDSVGDLAQPVWTPDGEGIVFEWRFPGNADSRIWSIHRDGTGLQQVSVLGEQGPGSDHFPTLSQDGSTVIFDRGGASGGLIRALITGGEQQRILTPSGTPFGASAFAPR